MKVYLAGPMRGYDLLNFPAFEKATAALRAAGHEVFSPAEISLQHAFDPVKGAYAGLESRTIRDDMADDMEFICRKADAVVVLPGWEKSLGAMAEVHTAWAIGIPVVSFGNFLLGWKAEFLP